jgi:rSAM/selenodomain-associated transferase 2
VQLSVIIPTLNEASQIGSAIERAAALDPSEIVVADGGSSDSTVRIARQQGQQVVVTEQGRGVQQNAGARQAHGDLLLFLHADTWLEPQAAVQLQQMARDPRVSVGAFRQKITSPRPIYRWIERGNAVRACYWGLPYGDQGIFVRRNIFFECGGFPEVPIMEDLIFMRKVRRRTKIVLLPGPLYVSPRRWEQAGPLTQTLRNWGLLMAEQVGIPPFLLARWYRSHRHELGARVHRSRTD